MYYLLARPHADLNPLTFLLWNVAQELSCLWLRELCSKIRPATVVNWLQQLCFITGSDDCMYPLIIASKRLGKSPDLCTEHYPLPKHDLDFVFICP